MQETLQTKQKKNEQILKNIKLNLFLKKKKKK